MPSKRRGSQARRARVEDVATSATMPATSEACLQLEHRVTQLTWCLHHVTERLATRQLAAAMCVYVLVHCCGSQWQNKCVSLSQADNCKYSIQAAEVAAWGRHCSRQAGTATSKQRHSPDLGATHLALTKLLPCLLSTSRILACECIDSMSP